jgi:AhpD family alkylhydroperoxidase
VTTSTETTAAVEYVPVQPRIENPAALLPGLLGPIQEIVKVLHSAGVPERTMEMVHLRASQINGCAWCVNYGVKNAKRAGETDERLATVAVWREAPFFTAAERAALALAESVTRIGDGRDVPDEIWDEAAKHYDEKGLGALVAFVALTNLFNRINVSTRQPANAAMG